MLAKLQKDMLTAMKNKETVKKDTLRLIVSEIKKDQIDNKKELSESEIQKIIKRGIKSRREALKLFQQGNRNDLAETTQQELKVLEAYLPAQLPTSELEKIIIATITELEAATPRDTGKVMQAIMSKYSSQVNGKTVQQLVAAKLQPPQKD